MHKLINLLLLLAFAVHIVPAQVMESKRTDDQVKFRERTIELLRETSLEVSRMRSIENRISFSAELASLMWFHDEKVARSMYALTMNDFRELLIQLDGRMMTLDLPPDEETDFVPSFFGGPARSPVERKLRIAMAVRQQIAMSLAEHDGDLALKFFYETVGLITSAQFRKETEAADKSFEMQLIKEIADSNATTALKFGTASLKDGVDGNHVELLKKIYKKDADKGVDFGAAILDRIKSDRKSVKGAHVFDALLSFGESNLEASQKPGGKKTVYSRSDLRDLADQFAQTLLDTDDDMVFWGMEYVTRIEKYAPNRGVQLRAKLKKLELETAGAVREMRVDRITALSNVASNANLATGAGTASNANLAMAKAMEQKAAREKAEKQLMDDIKGFSKSQSKDDREAAVTRTRKSIAALSAKEKKIGAYTMLAVQLAKIGDKELADQVMREAERLINPAPKNYQDFMYSWMVGSGYAEVDPDRAFPLLTDTIIRANETIAAFVKVAEFIDINEEIIDDGEIQVGMFGGAMVRGLTKELGVANTTLMALAKADLSKAKALTNSFDRIETRVLAKMLILRAVLDDRKPPSPDETDAAAGPTVK